MPPSRTPSVARMIVVLCVSSILAAHMTAQSVAVPLRHEVYDFLKKMESKQLLSDYHDIVKPISRHEVARRLMEVEAHAKMLSAVDLRRLTFLQEEFALELGFVNPSWSEAPRRWHLVSVPIEGGNLAADPLLGFSEKRFGSKRVQKITNGIQMYGYAFDNIGVLVRFADNHEQGSLLDRTKRLTPEDGIPGLITARGGTVSYDFTDAQFSYESGGILVSLEKTQQSWATGRRGSISLSTKAPTFPQIRFQARLADWMTFTYVHGELRSGILDSARSYHTYNSGITDFVRPVYRQKYIAAHLLEMSPLRGIDLVLGESIVYSDRTPSLIYLLPVMFFKSGEHYNYDTDNTQFHISLDVTRIPGMNVYASTIIDEIKLTDIFGGLDQARNQLGYTLGVETFDLPVNDLEFGIEYTRINPWVYSHKYPSARFTNNGYDMGHWIGQNADNMFASLTYWISRELKATAWYEVFRKGGMDDVAYQYKSPSKPFLYGNVRTERSFALRGVYQPVRDVFVQVLLRSFSLTNEGNPAEDHSQKAEISFSLQYGVW